MAGALLVASVINFVLLLGERQRAALIEQSGPPMARFVDVARDVSRSPPPPAQARAGRGPGPGRHLLMANNPVDMRGLERDGGLERRLDRGAGGR